MQLPFLNQGPRSSSSRGHQVLLTGVLSSNWGPPLLFDPKPKEDPRDLFDREEEISKLRTGIKYPLTLLLGIRRSGKSSLIKVLMKEEDAVWIYLDLRKYEGKLYLNYRDLTQELEKALNTIPDKLRKLLNGVKGVNVMGLEVKLKWGRGKVEVSDLLERLSEIGEREGKRAIIALDESQELRKLKGYNLLYRSAGGGCLFPPPASLRRFPGPLTAGGLRVSGARDH
ncbi:ATP-binding protein [Caldivirga sp.]|uniref:ATP-binding protein n=1 Tax=Caldivirga sp. TaxID=2080243 RepID=UPI003D0F42AF